MEFIDTGSLEGDCSIEHGKQNDSSTPKIDTKSIPMLVLENLRGNISRGTTLLPHLDTWLGLLADTKVRNFDRPLSIKEDIIQLDISVPHIFGMNVLKSFDNLLKYFFGIWLLQPPPFPDIVEQVSSGAQLHDDDDVLVGLDGLVNFDHVIMPEFQKEIDLLHQFLLLHLISKALLIQ